MSHSLMNDAILFQLRLVPSQPASEKFMASLATSHSVYSRYQAAIHHDPPEKASKQQYTRFLVDSPLQVYHEFSYY